MKKLIIIPLLFLLVSVNGQIGRYPFYRGVQSAGEEGGEYPEELDNNTVAMYLYDESSTFTMTVDHPTYVEEWRDYFESGNDLDLVPVVWVERPVLNANGILFNGEGAFLGGVYTLNQPITIYIVFKQVTWSRWDFVFDGNNASEYGSLQQGSTDNSGYLRLYAGTVLQDDGDLALDTYGIVRVILNGESSSLQINKNTAVTGNAGSNDMAGFYLGSNGGGSYNSNIEVKAVIIRSVVDDGTTQSTIYDWLEEKYL
jgi:hypothetical protein